MSAETVSPHDWTPALAREYPVMLLLAHKYTYARIEELEAKTEALQAAVLELLGECGNPWPSGHPLSDVVAEALANHEPNNPRGKWCCDQHREAFQDGSLSFGEDSDHE